MRRLRRADPAVTLGHGELERVAGAAGLTVADIGARGGVKGDFAALERCVQYVLFEPDSEEYERLRSNGARGKGPEPCVLNCALAESPRSFALHLYRQRGCSSALRAIPERARQFSRGDYFELDGVIEVRAEALDDLVQRGECPAPDFIKIDVQGMEPDVFRGASEVLRSSVVGLRVEVAFSRVYEDQPLFSDVDSILRPYGFAPMRWLEFHDWRRRTRVKYPFGARDRLPVSHGQMMHGDVLYLRDPAALASETEQDLMTLARLGLVAATYFHFDHAEAAFARPGVKDWVREASGVDADGMLERLSASFRWRSAPGRALMKLHKRLDGRRGLGRIARLWR